MDFNFFYCVTGRKVLVVIGGDDNYKDSAEKQGSFLSRWARRKVSSQFSEEYLDGRQSFIFSWDDGHRSIHEEALLHYFDPHKKDKFVPEKKTEVTVTQVVPKQVCFCMYLVKFWQHDCEKNYIQCHRRTGNFLPGGAIIHLPKKFWQVAQIFTKQSRGN